MRTRNARLGAELRWQHKTEQAVQWMTDRLFRLLFYTFNLSGRDSSGVT